MLLQPVLITTPATDSPGVLIASWPVGLPEQPGVLTWGLAQTKDLLSRFILSTSYLGLGPPKSEPEAKPAFQVGHFRMYFQRPRDGGLGRISQERKESLTQVASLD